MRPVAGAQQISKVQVRQREDAEQTQPRRSFGSHLRSYLSLSHMTQQSDPPRVHPFNDKDVAVLVETGVVRVNEFARQPLFRITADGRTFYPP